MGKQIHLKRFSIDFYDNPEGFKTFPIWMKLFTVPMRFRSSLGISDIASIIGKPIHVNDATSIASYLDFARVCVGIKDRNSYPLQVEVVENKGTKQQFKGPKASQVEQKSGEHGVHVVQG